MYSYAETEIWYEPLQIQHGAGYQEWWERPAITPPWFLMLDLYGGVGDKGA